MTREKLAAKAITALHSSGFGTETFFDSDNCFDIIGRKGATTIVLKLYENIDSIRKGQGEELRKLSSVLGASCIIIGEKTKVFGLEDGVVYFRYDIPTVTITTFGGILEKQIPKIMYFKGKQIVDMDFEGLKKKRLGLELSLEELGKRVGVRPESLYRLEKGASTSLKTATRLEKELEDELVKGIKVLDMKTNMGQLDEDPDEKLLEKVQELGVKLALFRHSPFKAYGNTTEGIFMSTAKGKADIAKKALELKKTSAIVDTDSIIITKEYKYASVGGVPVIQEHDLDSMGKIKDLFEIMLEKKRKMENGKP